MKKIKDFNLKHAFLTAIGGAGLALGANALLTDAPKTHMTTTQCVDDTTGETIYNNTMTHRGENLSLNRIYPVNVTCTSKTRSIKPQ